MKVIQLKIDVTAIDKSLLFKSEKSGRVYLDAALLLKDADDQYGNRGMIVQNLPEGRRGSGEKGSILGNAKVFEAKSAPINDDDLPF